MAAKTTRASARSPLERLRRACLALPGAWEKLSHGEPTFWAGKRMFASFANADNHHGAGRYAVWCKATHATQDMLIARSPELYFSPPYAGASGWVGIYLDATTDWTEVADRLRHAHELAAPPRARKAKGRTPARARRPRTRKTAE
jgi:hypothetical protein